MMLTEIPLHIPAPYDLFETYPLDRLFGSGQWLQLTPGELKCTVRDVRMSNARFADVDVSCGVQLRKRIEPWRLAIVFVRAKSGSRILAGGKSYLNGCSLLVSGDELAASILGPSSILWLDVDRTALPAIRSEVAAPVKAVLARNDLDRTHLGALGAGATSADVERFALRALKRGAGAGKSAADENRERLVQTALDLMWTRIEEPPTLQDICNAAKCSVRTLIYVFNATFGMSPMKYFKIQRLNVAHRRLQSAESSDRIFDIAADCGFWHLGHFGVDYKSFFGTTPSMTMRSKPYDLSAGFFT
jgi:AraC-like DNA-binding protein